MAHKDGFPIYFAKLSDGKWRIDIKLTVVDSGFPIVLDLLVRCLEKVKKYSPKWWFDGDLSWYKVKHHLKQIQVKHDAISY